MDRIKQYWDAVADDLNNYPANPEIELIPLRTTRYATAFGVYITSIGPYRLFGYLSIPKGTGPFPAIYYTATYTSVLDFLPQGTSNFTRSRFVTFSLAARGQRNADKPYAAMFPGHFTNKISDPHEYVFRSVAADCLRGAQFLLDCPDVNREKTVVVGNDLALIVAALEKRIQYLMTAPKLFVDSVQLAGTVIDYAGYPALAELNDYLRMYPDDADKISETLSYFDPTYHATNINAKTLIVAGSAGSVVDASVLLPFQSSLRGASHLFESQDSSYKDGLYCEQWITKNLVSSDADPIVPLHWS